MKQVKGWRDDIRRGAHRFGVTAILATAGLLAGAIPASAGAAGEAGTIVYQVSPIARYAFSTVPADLTPSACVQQYGLACYTPADIRSAYDIPSSLTGAGQTIVIVDAYGSPTIRQDLATFDQAFGLPAPTLNIYYPTGAPTFRPSDATQVGWAEETSLDVEWAHAIAPAATIDLVVASNPRGNVLNVAEQFAVSHHLGNVMSMSFGAPEAAIRGLGNNLQLLEAHAVFAEATDQGMSLFASAGDSGATNGGSVPNALFPASDPLVTSVGGTDLFISDSGQYQGETVWNDSVPSLCPFGCDYGPFGATGGAPSRVFSTPSYQASDGSGFSTRTTADVAYNASVYTGILVYLSIPGLTPGFYFFGGTSEGAPSWAGIAALADQAAGRALGPLNPLLYTIAQNPTLYAEDFHDITIGNNGFAGAPGFAAGPGYDLPTGLGTPDVAHLIATLAGQS
jgi:subtilase family serine protease